MDSLRLAMDLCREVSNQLDIIGGYTLETGINRLAQSDEQTKAKLLVAKEGAKLGGRVFESLAGGITIYRAGENPQLKTFMVGSHLDAVPHGGRYDGPAGVLAGLAILKMLDAENKKYHHGIAAQIFTDEESPRFGKALIGSGLETGRGLMSDFELVSRLEADNGLTYSQAMQAQGINVGALKEKVIAGQPLLPLDHIGGFAELHIEQAKRLRNMGMDIGVVNAIRGNVRADIRFLGETGHSGAEAQFYLDENGIVQDERRDAAIGMNELETACYQKAKEIAGRGLDITFTSPKRKMPNASLTNICDDCTSRIEVRSTDPKVLSEMQQFIKSTTENIAFNHGLQIHADTKYPISTPTPSLSPKMINHLMRSAEAVGLDVTKLASGAGHDAMTVYLAGILTSMYFMPHDGKSHRPDEDMVINPGDDPFGLGKPFSNAVRAMEYAASNYNMAKIPMTKRHISFERAMIENGAQDITEKLLLAN